LSATDPDVEDSVKKPRVGPILRGRMVYLEVGYDAELAPWS